MIEQLGRDHLLARHFGDFLTDLSNSGSSPHTVRAYRGDLVQFAAHHDGEIGELTAAVVRAFLSEIADLSPSTRKRKRAAVASFCKWAVRHDLLDANPMDRIDTIKVPKTLPRPASAADVAKVLDKISSRRPRKDVPVDRLRDRVLFETAYVCGARALETCGLYVEDLVTPAPRPPSSTPCWTTRSPTPRSAPPAGAATGEGDREGRLRSVS